MSDYDPENVHLGLLDIIDVARKRQFSDEEWMTILKDLKYHTLSELLELEAANA
jgi:hypothetical protein